MDEGRFAMPAGRVGQEERKPAENGPAAYDVFVDLSDHFCDEAFLRTHLDRLAGPWRLREGMNERGLLSFFRHARPRHSIQRP